MPTAVDADPQAILAAAELEIVPRWRGGYCLRWGGPGEPLYRTTDGPESSYAWVDMPGAGARFKNRADALKAAAAYIAGDIMAVIDELCERGQRPVDILYPKRVDRYSRFDARPPLDDD